MAKQSGDTAFERGNWDRGWRMERWRLVWRSAAGEVPPALRDKQHITSPDLIAPRKMIYRNYPFPCAAIRGRMVKITTIMSHQVVKMFRPANPVSALRATVLIATTLASASLADADRLSRRADDHQRRHDNPTGKLRQRAVLLSHADRLSAGAELQRSVEPH